MKNSRVSRAKVKIIKGLTLSDFKTRKNGLAQLHPYLQSPRLQKNLTRASFLKKALRMRPKSQSGSTLKRKFSTLMKTSVTDMKSSKQEQRHKLIEESWALMKKSTISGSTGRYLVDVTTLPQFLGYNGSAGG